MIRIIGGIVILVLLGTGLVAGYLALSGRVSFLPRASSSSTLTISPELDTKTKEKYFKISLTANVSEDFRTTKFVIEYNKKFLGDIKGVTVNKKLGNATIDAKTPGRLTITTETKKGKLAPKDSALFSFQLKGKAVTQDKGTEISVNMKKSFIKTKGGTNLLTKTEPVTATIKIVKKEGEIDPPVCSKVVLTPDTAETNQAVTAKLEATPTFKPISAFYYKFESSGSFQEVKPADSSSHTFTTAGDYTVEAYAKDADGRQSETCSADISVSAPEVVDTKPVCESLTVAPTIIHPTTNFIATITGSTKTGRTVKHYTFDFDNGADSVKTATASSTKYSYSEIGDYILSATVTDNTDEVSEPCLKTITVTAGDPPNDDDTGDGDEDNDNNNNSSSSLEDKYDCNQDGVINIYDFNCFSDTYGTRGDSQDWAGAEYDCNNDGAINIYDFVCFTDTYGSQKSSDSGWAPRE